MGLEMVMLPEPVKAEAPKVGELLTVTFKLLGAVTVTAPAPSHACKSNALMFDLLVKPSVPAFTNVVLGIKVASPESTSVLPAPMVVVPV